MTYWHDKVVVVTGGSAGLGLVLSQSFAAAGCQVIVAARGQAQGQQAVETIGPEKARFVTTDVTDSASVNQLVEQVIQREGRIDAWVNNAGRSSRGLALETSVEEFEQLLQLNFLALARCSQAAIPHLIKSRGHLVNIGSLSSKTASPYMGGYATSKYPVAAYSQQLRLEHSPRSLHVLLVAPGPIRRQDSNPRYQDQARDLPESAGKPGGGVKLKGICPQRLSTKILKACQRRQPELVVPGYSRFLFALAQLCPRWGDWIVRKMTGARDSERVNHDH
ncbi:MAG: SDR family NAD(P)-dependent oxidoreductase [Pirellulaceae bacterium]